MTDKAKPDEGVIIRDKSTGRFVPGHKPVTKPKPAIGERLGDWLRARMPPKYIADQCCKLLGDPSLTAADRVRVLEFVCKYGYPQPPTRHEVQAVVAHMTSVDTRAVLAHLGSAALAELLAAHAAAQGAQDDDEGAGPGARTPAALPARTAQTGEPGEVSATSRVVDVEVAEGSNLEHVE